MGRQVTSSLSSMIGDRFGLLFFAENFNSEILSDSSDQYDDFGQILDAFSLMALNSLKTENDVNELKVQNDGAC